ncbi:MAG: hypothetical protein IJW24_01535 [Clostridia bacterium]|nr:hypothetical protein [Clostridia bacterium]
MKKFTTFIGLVFCLISSFIFSACSSPNVIDPTVYLNSTVNAKVYGVGTTQKIDSNKITSKIPSEQKKYLSHEIKLNKDWIYGMHIESISYYILSNKDMEDVEFNLTLTGTENGEATLTNATKTFNHLQKPYTLKAGKPFKVYVKVNDKISLSTSDSVLTISLYDTYTDPGFEYCIYGLEIVGEHKS